MSWGAYKPAVHAQALGLAAGTAAVDDLLG